MILGIFRSNGLSLAVTLQCHLRPAEAKKRHRVKSVVFEAFYFRCVVGIGGQVLVGYIYDEKKRSLTLGDCIEKTLPKAQRTRGLSSSYESNLMGHITSSNTNLDQISSS